ncbi:MAG TPA: dockerin type I domain-containing protein, partial [Phycisphaerae bacterium]|nr:dockerin type I domain-containing protein [Phycisphaerae bacterium]
SDDADWTSIDNGTGTIPSRGSVDVTVSFNHNAEALANDDYRTTVSFVNLTDHHGDRTREVRLEVGIPQVIYSFPLDTDPGWQTEGDWAFGQPTGQGGAHGSPDPTSGFTGPNVYGYNLDGDYPGDLWFTSLTTTALDCSNLSHVKLRFRRWLGVRDQPDDAYIRLSTDNDFFLYIWASETEVYDNGWQLVEYDLSPFADGESTVYVQWTIGPTYLGGACGWNIDDVEILGVEVGGSRPGDLNGDGAVDMVDFELFAPCMGGPGVTAPPPGSVASAFDAADLDGDGDVDITDFCAFQAAFVGP